MPVQGALAELRVSCYLPATDLLPTSRHQVSSKIGVIEALLDKASYCPLGWPRCAYCPLSCLLPSAPPTPSPALSSQADKVIIGGGMAFTFLKARGLSTGDSMVEEDQIELASRLEASAIAKGVELLLPIDYVVAEQFEGGDSSAKVH